MKNTKKAFERPEAERKVLAVIKIFLMVLLTVGLLQAQIVRDTIIVIVNDTSIKTPASGQPPYFTAILKGSTVGAIKYEDYQATATTVQWTNYGMERIIFTFLHGAIGGSNRDTWRGFVSIKPVSGYKITPDSLQAYIPRPTDNIPVVIKMNFYAGLTTSTLVLPQQSFKRVRPNSTDSRQFDLLGRFKNYGSGVYIKNDKSLLIVRGIK